MERIRDRRARIGRALGLCLFTFVALSACSDDPESNPNANAGEGGASGMSGDRDGGGDGDGDGDGDASVAGMGGMGGMGGTGGVPTTDVSHVSDEPFAPTGEPIQAPDMTWQFIEFPDTQCRDGSPTGIGVSLNSASDKVMIFMNGGGACFDSFTCLANPANDEIQKAEQKTGIFARDNELNPVKDWNWIFIPYCTGDVHLGTNVNGMIGTEPNVFAGRLNLAKFLNRLVPTFADAEQVLLTGISAGGFGAAANMEFVQWAFGDVPVTAIDDSGPPMASEFLDVCLQERWASTWGFDQSILADCGEDCEGSAEYSIPYTLHVAEKFPDRMGGLIETTADAIITSFYGYSLNDCTGSLLTPMPKDMFTAGLLDYRATIQDLGANLGTFYVDGNQHTWLTQPLFYTQEVEGVLMVDWFADIVEGTAAAHLGP